MKALAGGLACLLAASPAAAQLADENAGVTAEDAFGSSVGNEAVGLYTSGDIRGFSAVQAGNVRVEGLYYDRAGSITDVVVKSTTVRLGLSAFGYPFPAPTGIVDTNLRRAGQDRVLGVRVTSGEFFGPDLIMDAAIPIDDRLGVNLDLGLYDDEYVDGSGAWFVSYGSVVRWRPVDGLELTGVFARYDYGDEEKAPTLFTDGAFLPKPVRPRVFFGQDWADWAGHSQNYGAVAKWTIGDWRVETGLFNSRFTQDRYASAFYGSIDRDGVGDEVVVSGRDQRYASTSGELRLSRAFQEGPRAHRVLVALRGRDKQDRYGGFAVAQLGPGEIGVPDPQPEPSFAYGPLTDDTVRQRNYAVGYDLLWKGVGELNLGLTRASYAKRVVQPSITDEQNDEPWLWNAALAVTPTSHLTLYAAATRGLEESGVSPDRATNRGLVLPALRTAQEEVGLRWRVAPQLSLAAAVFSIRKPYFEIDAADGAFKTLGDVSHDGVEVSLSGTPLPGLTAVIGAVFLDAKVSGVAVEEGRIGRRPIGRTDKLIDLNLDYKLAAVPGLSIDVGARYEDERVANAAATLYLPARATVDLGVRYQTILGKVPATIRAQLRNANDVSGWRVFSGGGFALNQPRRLVVTLTADL